MNNKVIIGTVVAIVILGGLYFVTRQNNDKMTEKKGSTMMEGEQAMKKDDVEALAAMEGDKDDTMTLAGGQYIAYDASKLTFAKEGKVVLFFNATWCPTCQAIDKDIKASLADIPKDVLILSVDYDTYKDLKTKYGVTTQHTFVQVDADGKSLGKWVGGSTLEALLERLTK